MIVKIRCLAVSCGLGGLFTYVDNHPNRVDCLFVASYSVFRCLDCSDVYVDNPFGLESMGSVCVCLVDSGRPDKMS